MAARPLSPLATLGAMPLSMLTATARTARAVAESDSAIRQPIATSRRVGFVQLHGGSGLSTTAAAVASVLAPRRSGRVLGVDAAGGPLGFGWHAGTAEPTAPSAPTVQSERRQRARDGADAVAGLPQAASGLFTLRVGDAGAPASTVTWAAEVSSIARFFDLVCTDWGVRPWQSDLAEIAGSSHVVCLLARAERRAAEEAVAMIAALQGQESGPRVVLALVDVANGRRRDAGRVLETVAGHAGVPVLGMPFDAARAAGRPARSPSRLAAARLAGTIVSSAIAPPVTVTREGVLA
ncbi:MinD-like ATPase involved in chromosome partitioning or flagellar assembly [Microterricola gilva]|uniref:MinD-like ATPase involved in chromosome partitioning or flagellar assembly n=1 Tax=Microterricola gilva TaxID=393267 RepID=A0A4Q8AIC0_9MICO|nr:hypothetical protein [Microterricola gilva]RZU64124.1 MinD-like ATPase involved in chromosome partitioning or flagellar assembly [Microterricola gilva]